jgi:Domain of unknown function (DUF4410)
MASGGVAPVAKFPLPLGKWSPYGIRMAIKMIRQLIRPERRGADISRFLLFFSLAVVAGCTTRIANTSTQGPPTVAASARPTRVLVADFAAAPGIVQLDTSPGVEVERAASGTAPQQAAAQDIRDVQSALSDTLVQRIQAMGLPAIRVPAGTMPGPDELLVSGQITAIEEGSRARRTVIGFGAGKTSVQGNAALLRGSASGPQVLQTYSTSANSGRMPGMGVGAAAGGAKSAASVISGGAHAAGEVTRTPVGDQAATIAKHLATNLGQFFAQQNWIAASAVPGP